MPDLVGCHAFVTHVTDALDHCWTIDGRDQDSGMLAACGQEASLLACSGYTRVVGGVRGQKTTESAIGGVRGQWAPAVGSYRKCLVCWTGVCTHV
jgi:hypothetical protein